MKKFWDIYDERLELCHRALQIRHNSLMNVKSDVAPILWQHGAFARLKPGEEITPYLFNNYSTISLGYAGLYECVKYITGEDHWKDEKAIKLAHKILDYLNRNNKELGERLNVSVALYGTPKHTWGFIK